VAASRFIRQFQRDVIDFPRRFRARRNFFLARFDAFVCFLFFFQAGGFIHRHALLGLGLFVALDVIANVAKVFIAGDALLGPRFNSER
jgi:hypothetical protein